jgi:hypothetical protein
MRKHSQTDPKPKGESTMKSTHKSLQMGVVLVIATLSIISPGSKAAAQGNERGDEGRHLVGTWMVQVTREDCQTHVPVGPPFLSLLTYNRGGTMTDSTSNPQFGQSVRGPGHGVWTHTNDHSYKVFSAAFVTMNATLVSTQFLKQAIDVTTPNDYVVPTASVQFVSPDGTILSTGCATAVGKRLGAEE